VDGPSTTPRYLGLDIGSKRIGVAVTDELGLTVQPVLTLNRRSQTREDLRSIARLCRRYNVTAIVVGDPVHLSGEVSKQAEQTREFAKQLGELTKLEIHYIDERLTSHRAHEILYEAGRKRQEHDKIVDQVAAVLILESFMAMRQQSVERKGAMDEGNPQTRV
jgi:putative Holliday junction resolvase